MTGIRVALGWVGPAGQTLVAIIEGGGGFVSEPFRREASHGSVSEGETAATHASSICWGAGRFWGVKGRI
jgi:hypothetical protein